MIRMFFPRQKDVDCYGTIESETTWEIIIDDIPVLKAYCLEVISQNNKMIE